MIFEPKDLICTDDWKKWFDENINIVPTLLSDLILKEIRRNLNSISSPRLYLGLFPQQIIMYGHLIGAKLEGEKLKYSQLRRFVDALKEIDNLKNWQDKLYKINLFPIYLVNGAARQDKLLLFTSTINGIIMNNWIIEQEDFDTLLQLVDSITSYFGSFRKEDK